MTKVESKASVDPRDRPVDIEITEERPSEEAMTEAMSFLIASEKGLMIAIDEVLLGLYRIFRVSETHKN